jgi:hypothetical protein
MRTETDINAKKRGGRIAAESTTALTSSSLGMRSTNKPDTELISDDEAEDNGPPRRRRKRRHSNGKSGKGAAAKTRISAPTVASEYMSTRQAAQYLNLSRQYLEAARYRGDGSGPPYIKLERAVRYRRSVLDAWMSAHDHSPDKPTLVK